MPAAFIPSPSGGGWHAGPLPVRGYALCLVTGIIVTIWVTRRWYLRGGGRGGDIADVAAWAVPFALVGSRLYVMVLDHALYFGPGRDWAGILKLWDGGMGLPGILTAGGVGALIGCRRAGIAVDRVAGAAAVGLPFGLAVASWGDWFSQQHYGRPSLLPWAVEISPANRVPGYENYATYQPTFLYTFGWDILVGVAVIWAVRRFALSGDRALAVFLAAYTAGSCATQSLLIDSAPHLLGLRVSQWLALVVFAGAVAYLQASRHTRGPGRVLARLPGRRPGKGRARFPAAPAARPPAARSVAPGNLRAARPATAGGARPAAARPAAGTTPADRMY